MFDRFGRDINYLRVSVTDRCNLRCRYCMPEHGISHVEHAQVLRLEEVARLVGIAASLGISRIRITGGEPLLRKNLCQLIHDISNTPGIEDLALTTNGLLFTQYAAELKAAGLKRVNFSLDTLREDRFQYITRSRASVKSVRAALQCARELQMEPIKLNMVVIRGYNDDEIFDFAELAERESIHVRFIEFMPIGDLLYWQPERLLSTAEIRAQLEQRYTLFPAAQVYGHGPARYYSLPGSQGTLGFISALSDHFCAGCNRLRMTAGGMLCGCLYNRQEIDVKTVLRSGADDETLRQIFLNVIDHKPEKHALEHGWERENSRRMYQIGG